MSINVFLNSIARRQRRSVRWSTTWTTAIGRIALYNFVQIYMVPKGQSPMTLVVLSEMS